MEFTKDQLLVIEEALLTARDNTGDEKWLMRFGQY